MPEKCPDGDLILLHLHYSPVDTQLDIESTTRAITDHRYTTCDTQEKSGDNQAYDMRGEL
jgi:hypothetical protein